MEELPYYVISWVLVRTKERRYQCILCTKGDGDHGSILGIHCHLRSRTHIERIMQQEAMFCQTCQLQCKYPSHYKAHIESKAHNQKVNSQPKIVKTYNCDVCNVTFQSHKDELRHLATKKHTSKTDSTLVIRSNFPTR